MSDNLAPLFADRATRLQALPDSERAQFQTLEQSSGDPMYGDRQFSALWMSKRTGLPHAEIIKNFDQLSAAYFGEGTTAAQAYERIAETYKPKESVSSEQAGESGDALSSSGSVISKDFAGSLARGASATGYGTLAGTFSMLSAATGITLKKPDDREDFKKLGDEFAGEMIADYRSFAAGERKKAADDVSFELGMRAEPGAVAPVRESRAGLVMREMSKIRAEVKAENDAAMEKLYADNPQRYNFTTRMRKASDVMYDLANAQAEDFGVRPEFADTLVGQFVQSAGSLPATALFAYMGPMVGGAAMTGLMYSEVEQDRKAVEGDNYDPTGALFSNLASAGPQAAMEYAFGMERVMNKVIKDTAKIGGRIMFKEGVKAMVRAAAASGLEEAITNPAQSLWSDVAAKLSYDEGRELFTPEKFKQRLIEAGSGAALGFLFGGPVQGIGNVDRNMAAAKADRYLTTREGQPFTQFDFNALRIARTDEEIKAMAPDGETGDLLLKAASGDVAAQAEYNKTAQQKAFIDTDGVSVEGVSIGKIGEQLALRNDDGTITVIDANDPEQLAFFNQVKADAAVQVQATEQTLARLQGKFGEMLEVQRPKAFDSLAEMVRKGELSEEQANDALGSAKAFNGLVGTLTLDNTAPTGKASAKQRNAVWRMAVQVLQGASPDVAVEEVSEAWVHKGIKDQNLTFDELHALRADWYAKSGEQDPSTGKGLTPERSSIEWFSKRVVEYALANRKVELPGGWGKWLRTIGDRLKEFLGGAIKMKGMLRRGEVAPKLEQFMREALGTGKAEMSAEAFKALTPTEKATAAESYLQKSPQGLDALKEDLRAEVEAVVKAEQANAEAAPVVSELDAEMLDEAEKSAEFPAITGNEGDGFQVTDSAGKNIGAAQDLEAAKNIAIEWFYNQALAEEKAQAMADLGTTKADELQRVIIRLGGLIAPSQGDMSGELRSISENMTTSQKLRMFRKDALSLDAMAEALRGEGFKFDTPNDLLVALEKSTKGDAVYPQQGEQGGLMGTFSLAQTETPEFKKWFGDSKVVDAQGKPLVVYHGTSANFRKFNMKKQIQGIIWFTSNKSKIEQGEVGAAGSGKILELFASIQNPAGWDVYDKRGLYEFKGLGYDGAILPDGDGGFDGFVFKSEQLKSATKNKGTFDPTNADITFSLERKPAPARFVGYQENVPGKPPIELFNLTEPILGRPTNSTVSRKTLEDGGYEVPVVEPEPMTAVEAREQAKFETYAIPQNKRQAYAQKMAQFAAKNAANFPYPYHLLATQVKQAQVSLGGHQVLINALQSGQSAGMVGKTILPMSERLRFMVDKYGENIGILIRARRYEFEKATLLKKYSDMVTPLMHGLTQMNAQDLQDWSVAASNQDKAKRDLITAKYKLEAEWAQYEAARDKLRAEMISAGIEVGLIEEYFPRWCKDVIALRSSLGIVATDAPFEQAVIEAEKKIGRALTNEEMNEVIDKAVRGIGPRPVGGAKPSNTKGRSIATIQPDQWVYYADANHALSRYLEQATESIARYRFFGKDNVILGGPKLPPSFFNASDSVGAVIAEQVAAGKLRPDQQQEIIDLLSSYFAPKGISSAALRGAMDLTYLATMGQFKSVLAQVPDVVTNIIVAGPWNTFVDLPRALLNNVRYLPGIGNVKSWSEAVGKATQSKTRYSREELGVTRMLDEFKDPRKTATILNEVFTGLGFNFVDGIFKDVLMNAKLKQLSKAARGGSLSASDMKMINGVFGSQGAANVIADLKAGVKTDDTKFLAFNILADWHPINLLEYPEYYARAGNFRVLYALKIYSCKMLAAYRREGQLLLWFGDAKAGTAKLLKGEGKAAWNIYTQDMSQKAAGARRLTALVAMLFMAGFSKDWIVDFFLDRDPQPEDIAVDNMFKLLQVSRYAVWKSRNRANDNNIFGFTGTAANTLQRSKEVLMDIAAPPTVLLDRPMADLGTWAKAQQTGDAIDFWGLESVKFIPGAGDPLFWYSDTGRGKIKRRQKLREQAERSNRRSRRRD